MWITVAALGIGLWVLVATIVLGLAVSAGRGDQVRIVEATEPGSDSLRTLRSAA